MLLSGMWIYGVSGGINLLMMEGLNFKSPIGAISDALIFVVVLAFSIFLATYLWKHRDLFLKATDKKESEAK